MESETASWKRRHGIYDRQNAGSRGLQSQTFIILYVGSGILLGFATLHNPEERQLPVFHLFFTGMGNSGILGLELL